MRVFYEENIVDLGKQARNEKSDNIESKTFDECASKEKNITRYLIVESFR